MATGRGIAFVRTQITLIESMANREADEHLWNRFFDLYYSAMVKYAEMFCASHDAEDIVQRVLVKLVGILKSGRYERRPGIRFRSYLMTLIRHEFIDWRREETARGLGAKVPFDEDAALSVQPDAEERKSLFLAEGRALARVSHPRVVRIHDFVVDEETGTPYFSMDLVLSPDGVPTTLDEACSRGIDEERAAAWFADVCEGLDYIHSQGIVHGDVKLENILIGPDGRAVISDFGISRVFGDEVRRRSDSVPDDVSADLSALHMGTYGYLAPPRRNRPPPMSRCRPHRRNRPRPPSA